MGIWVGDRQNSSTQRCPCPSPCTLHDKTDFAVWVRIWEDYFGLSSGSNLIMQVLNSGEPFKSLVKGRHCYGRRGDTAMEEGSESCIIAGFQGMDGTTSQGIEVSSRTWKKARKQVLMCLWKGVRHKQNSYYLRHYICVNVTATIEKSYKIVSIFWLLWFMLLWTFAFKYFCVDQCLKFSWLSTYWWNYWVIW